MAKNLITRRELDAWFSSIEQESEAFDALVLEKAANADALGLALEILDSKEWTAPDPSAAGGRLGAYLHQFRRDVDRILPLDRVAEVRLAQSIEFARVRFDRARERFGFQEGQFDEQLDASGSGWSVAAIEEIVANSRFPRDLVRRWVELHALRAEFVERNLYLVLINVERYAQAHASRIDMVQEGCISLFRAVDGFNWRRGLLFRTYAVHWLNQAFRNHLYNFGSTVRVPVYLQKVMKNIREARIAIGDPAASVSAIAHHGGLNEHLVSMAIRATRTSYSLDAELWQEGRGRVGDLLEDRRSCNANGVQLDRISLGRDLSVALEGLKQRERSVLQMRFGLGAEPERTLAEVARVLGLSIERVRQIQISALRKLAAPSSRPRFEAYLN